MLPCRVKGPSDLLPNSSHSKSVSLPIILIIPQVKLNTIGTLMASEKFNSITLQSLIRGIKDITSHKEVEEKFRHLVNQKRIAVNQLVASPSVQKEIYYKERAKQLINQQQLHGQMQSSIYEQRPLSTLQSLPPQVTSSLTPSPSPVTSLASSPSSMASVVVVVDGNISPDTSNTLTTDGGKCTWSDVPDVNSKDEINYVNYNQVARGGDGEQCSPGRRRGKKSQQRLAKIFDETNDEAKYLRQQQSYKSSFLFQSQVQLNLNDLLPSVIDQVHLVTPCDDTLELSGVNSTASIETDGQISFRKVNDDELICKDHAMYSSLINILTHHVKLVGDESEEKDKGKAKQQQQNQQSMEHLSLEWLTNSEGSGQCPLDQSPGASDSLDLVLPDEESNCKSEKQVQQSSPLSEWSVVKEIITGALLNYTQSVKLAVTMYLLRSKQTAQSVGLPSQVSSLLIVTNSEESGVGEGCFILTPTVPWHMSVEKSFTFCDTNLLITSPLIEQIRLNWFTNYSLYKLDAFNNITFPSNVQYFTSRISINLSIIKTALTYEWVSGVANMFNSYINSNNIHGKGERLKLSSVVYTFMSRLLRQFVIGTIENWVTIVTNSNGNRMESELFVARADYIKGQGCHLDPSPDAWPWLLEYPIREVINSFQQIPRIESHLNTLPDDIYAPKASGYLWPVDEVDDWQVNQLKNSIDKSIVSGIPSNSMLHLLEDAIKTIEIFKTKATLAYDIDKFRSIIQNQLSFEKSLIVPQMDRSVKDTGLVLINYTELRTKILYEAKAVREKLTKSKVCFVINLGHYLCAILNDIKVRIEAVTESTEEIVNSIKSMNDYRMLVRCIFKDIEFIDAHWNFLTEEGSVFLSDTDYELMHNLYNWPTIIKATFSAVDTRLGASKARKEAKLRDKISSFNTFLDALVNELINFNKKRLSSPLEKISDNVKQLEQMELTIEEAFKTKSEINFEEGLLGWPIQTKFDQLDVLRAFKYPIDLLWKTADEFEIKSHTWVNLKMKEIDIPRISLSVNRMKDRIKSMNSAISEAVLLKGSELDGLEEVRSSIDLLESKVTDFEKIKIPLLSVLKMPELREKHLMEVGSVLEKEDLTLTNLTTLTDLSNVNLDIEKVNQIQNIGLNAIREHELEVFLSRMKNEWISDDEWPGDALNIAANKFLEEESLTTKVKEECVTIFKYVHDSSRKYVSDSGTIGHRKAINDRLPPFKLHFTPPSFVELILTFKTLLKKKQTQILSRQHRYKGGVEKLNLAASFVSHMKKKLIEEDKPKLERMSAETEKLMVEIEEETIEVEWTKERIASDEGLANAAAALAQQIKDECTKELASAVPAVESAVKALDTLVPEDIVFLRTMKNPPLGLKMVLESVAVLLAYSPDKKIGPDGLLYDDYWSAALRMLNSSEIKLLEALKTFDRDHVKSELISLVRQCYLCYDDFDPIALRSVSIASESLAKWVKAIDIYDRVINVIKPKKVRLLQAEQELSELVDKVYTKKTELQLITDKLQGLSDRFAAVSKEKKELEENIMKSGLKLERAEKLLGGLELEKERWAQASEQLNLIEETIIGDAILAAGFIVYLSGLPFNGRQVLLERWQDFMNANTYIHFSLPFKLSEAAATQLEIQTWIVAGLPIEQFYLDNATIMTNSRRYCYIVDPVMIASDFIKKYHSNTSKGLMILTQLDELSPGIYIQIRKNITRGKPVLLEDVTREKLLDSFVQSILIKDIDESTSGSAYITLGLTGDELEYNKDFNLYMTTKGYFELPRDIYSRICIINWIDESFNSMERKANLEQAMKFQERAKKEKQLIELEDKLLESLSMTNTLDNEDAVRLLLQYKALASQLQKEK